MTMSPAPAVPLTLTTAVAARTVVPLVPLTVTLKLPDGVEAGTATVIVAVPPPVIDCGLNATVAADGAPLAVRSTRPAKPPVTPTATENDAVPPAEIVRLAGVAVTLKSDCATG